MQIRPTIKKGSPETEVSTLDSVVDLYDVLRVTFSVKLTSIILDGEGLSLTS